jgi:hypothetical protein
LLFYGALQMGTTYSADQISSHVALIVACSIAVLSSLLLLFYDSYWTLLPILALTSMAILLGCYTWTTYWASLDGSTKQLVWFVIGLAILALLYLILFLLYVTLCPLLAGRYGIQTAEALPPYSGFAPYSAGMLPAGPAMTGVWGH